METYKNNELRKYLDGSPSHKGWKTRRHPNQVKIWYVDHICLDTSENITFVYYSDEKRQSDWKLVHKRNIEVQSSIELVG